MHLTFTKRILSVGLLLALFAIVGLSGGKVFAQEAKVYAMSPDGRTNYDVCSDEILVQFEPSVPAGKILSILSKDDRIVRLKADEILPSPKNLVRVRLKKALTNSEWETMRKTIEQMPEVRYAQQVLQHCDGTRQGVSNKIAVKLKQDSDFQMLQNLTRKEGILLQDKYAYDNLVYFLEVPKAAGNPLTLANRLAESGLFAWAEVDFFRFMKHFSTNDQFLANQWSLNNTGSAVQFNGTPGADMKVFNAWNITTGSSSIKIAILDEGVDLVHPDLVGNMLPGFDGTGLNSAGAPSGNDAHGTACAGIVAATGNNNIGITGVAYQSKIVPVRIAYSSGANWVTQNSWIGTCIDWSWQTAGADILSNSWGGGGSSALINDPITRSVTQGRGGLGAPVLFAAGNNNGAVSYPATLSNVIAVAAMSMCDQRKSPTSCDGETFWGSNFGTNLDISAPGVKIYATDISGAAGYSTGNYTATFNGTSSACPNAAGVMALILSVNPGLNNAQARQIIESTCDKVGGYSYTANANQPNGTWTNELGHGRVNAFAAVQLANPQPCTTPAVAAVNVSPSSVCGSGNVNLSMSGISFGLGQTYQWQSSSDNLNWTNLSGQTAQTASASVSSATWFRCIVTCGTSVTSQTAQVTISNPVVSTFPHSQNFDGGSSLPCGWSVQNANNDGNTWALGTASPRSAPNNVAYIYNATNAANDWLFSAPLQLTAGQSYRVRFWYRARSASYVEQMEVKWGNAANATAMTSPAIFSNTNIVNTTYAEGTTIAFTPTSSGIYHVGFRVFSAADKYDLYLDDVTIELTSSCTTPTVAGTVIGGTTLTAGNSGVYNYNGGNGTSINWQQSIGAGGSFTDIIGATSATLSYTNIPGTYSLRVRASSSNCPDAFSNAISVTVNPRIGDNLNLPIEANLPFSSIGNTENGSGYSNAYTGTNNQSSPDVFYRFATGACVDSLVISTCGSGFDTYLHLLNATGTQLFSNDDNGPSCTGTSSSLKVAVLPNTTYFVVVEGYGSSLGAFSLSISPIDNPIATASISAAGPLSFCAGGSVELSASAGSTYSWSNGATTQAITATESGSYSVTVTDANGCTSSASVDVTVFTPAQAIISAAGPLSFCAGGSVELSASAGSAYSWSNGATTQAITATESGSYAVTVTDANGCTSSASATVTVFTPAQASVSASGPLSFCAGGSVDLSASSGSAYSWSNGATTPAITATESGSYSVTVTDANGCTSSASETVTVFTPAQASVSASGPLSFCSGGSVELSASAGSAYNWSNGSTTQAITASESGSFAVTVTDANGCTSLASETVTVFTPAQASISASGPLSFCAAGSVDLSASAGSAYSWSNGATTQAITASESGSYSVIVTDANGCTSSASVDVTVFTPQQVSVSTSGPLSFCAGGSVELSASAGTAYSWSNGATTQAITATESGSYSVIVTDANGCSSSASVDVTVFTNPAVDAGTYSSVTTNDVPVNLAGSPMGGTFSGSFVSNGSFNPALSGAGTFSFTYSFTDANGCSASDEGSIEVLPGCALSVGTISGPTNSCPHQGTTGVNATYSVTATDATTYLWTIPSGATNVSGQGTASISFKFASTFTTGSVSVVVSGCNGSETRNISVTRATPATPGTISGPVNVCAYRGTGDTVTYSIAPVANALSYTWTIPTNVTLVSANGGTSVQVLINSAFTTGSIRVRANSGCANSSTRSLSLNTSLPSTPGTISGNSRGCPGDVRTYTIANTNNATSYLWTVPAGTTIISGAGTTSIQLAFDAGFTASGALSVRGVNGCGQGAVRTLTLSRNTPGTPARIVGQATGICGITNLNYSVLNPVAGMTYNWTAPAGVTILSGQGTSTISVSVAPTFVSGNLSVNASNACATSSNRTVGLNTRTATPGTIAGTATGICSGSVMTYSVNTLVGATSYLWTVPSGWVIQSGQGTNSISVAAGTAGGSITVRGVNACGNSSTRSLAVTVVNCARTAMDEGTTDNSELIVEAYPNPFDGILNIRIEGTSASTLQAEVFDLSGRSVYQSVISNSPVVSFNPPIEAGIYMLRISDGNTAQQSLRIVKVN
jgi:hypothetical protein